MRNKVAVHSNLRYYFFYSPRIGMMIRQRTYLDSLIYYRHKIKRLKNA